MAKSSHKYLTLEVTLYCINKSNQLSLIKHSVVFLCHVIPMNGKSRSFYVVAATQIHEITWVQSPHFPANNLQEPYNRLRVATPSFNGLEHFIFTCS